MTHTPFSDGNRLPLPPEVSGRHLLYLTEPLKLDAAAVATVVAKVHALVEERGLYAGQVDVFSGRHLEDATAAFEQLCRAFPPECLDHALVVCQQAFPHEDASFSGGAFYSAVLSTGPSPYLVQTFHHEVDEQGALALHASSRVLHVGDCLVLDPTTPHMCSPLRCHDDSLLILLQANVNDETPQDRAGLTQCLAPKSDDCNVRDLSCY